MEMILDDFLKKIMLITKKQINKYNKYKISDKDFIILTEMHKLAQQSHKISTTTIADAFEFTLPAAMKHLKILEKNNLVKRETSTVDKRIKYYTIATEVYKYMNHVQIETNKIKEKLVERVGKENMLFLKDILEELVNFAKEEIL